ncbi:hypothetical protein K493DRAFT_385921 [Basidiobolus meristosporus CBS 931.73]|uniref:Uncharacterized protein n=1 Tax=Basidiobolus meristosporus CBS 931.73 TaxID=1314790 RepID=A0A1Y1XP76_9FUNG|nr:hypothetical protein K493DRAFT_385921 [Basidiobolus meristosporus CBS 931.73]|eukprot:ORX87542.1 hypothetical protein K493DRAFT_385921 [Basidiobolus meristosporus CBS 931.73]
MTYIKTNATCCCCLNLRLGCLILTFIQLVIGIATTVLVILNWVGVTNSSFGTNGATNTVNSNATLNTLGNVGQYVSFGSFIVMLLIGLFGFVGTLKCKPWMLLIYVIITTIIMLANLVGVVFSFINRQWYNGMLALISLLVQGYFIYAVYRYRKVILAARHAANYSGAYAPENNMNEYNAHPYNTAQPMAQQPANIVHAPDKSYAV